MYQEIINSSFHAMVNREPTPEEMAHHLQYCKKNFQKGMPQLTLDVEHEIATNLKDFTTKYSTLAHFYEVRVEELFKRRLQRKPTANEMAEYLKFIDDQKHKLKPESIVHFMLENKIITSTEYKENHFDPHDYVITQNSDLFTFPVEIDEDPTTEYFCDPNFPADVKSLYDANEKTVPIPSGAKKVTQWLRPHQIKGVTNPQLFVDGSESGDVIQGGLGDCWFLSALSIVSIEDEIIEQLIACHPKDPKKKGRYVFRFFKDGRFREVEIDDRLPCDKKGNLVFAKCKDPNEMWVPLIEKAYAKLYGNYQSLAGGFIKAALIDLTGGIALPAVQVKPEMAQTDDLWKQLVHWIETPGYVLGCSIEGGTEGDLGTTGLLTGHAYSVLKSKEFNHPETGEKIRLVELRNPWGMKEWKGRWSDASPLWTEATKACVGGVKHQEDGAFWMCYEDFCKYWTEIDVVRFFNSTSETKMPGYSHWAIETRKDEWVGETAGGIFGKDIRESRKNPQYVLDLKQDSEVFVCLSQRDYRYLGDEKEADYCIGFHVFKYEGLWTERMSVHPHKADRLNYFNSKLQVAAPEFWEFSRDMTIQVKLPAGQYWIIPSTFKAGSESQFFLRVCTQGTFSFTALPPFEYAYKNIAFDDELTAQTAGGSVNTWKWINGPQYLLKFTSPNPKDQMIRMSVNMRQQRELNELLFINFYVLQPNEPAANAPATQAAATTEKDIVAGKRAFSYKVAVDTQSFTQTKESNWVVEAHVDKEYIIVPATFNAGELTKFSIGLFYRKDIFPEANVHLIPIDKYYQHKEVQSAWVAANAGGCVNNAATWKNNPKFRLVVKETGTYEVVICQVKDKGYPAVGMHVFPGTAISATVTARTKSWTFGKVISLPVYLQAGQTYTIMPSTYKPGELANFILRVYSACQGFTLTEVK